MQLNHTIELNETLSDLNLRDANIENSYYKCIIKDGSSIKYKFKESYNVLRYKGDLHVMNKRCILDTDLYNKLWDSV